MSVTSRITIEEAMAIHDTAIERFGGEPGVRDQDTLEAALTKPWSSFGGHDLYDGLVGKACRSAYDVMNSRPFVDGNRRTGAALLGVYLRRADIPFSPDHQELATTITSVANDSMSYVEFLEWVRSVIDA